MFDGASRLLNRAFQRAREAGLLRMTPWLAVGAALYALTFGAGLQESAPGLQSAIYNLANITLRAWLGYWITRNIFGRLGKPSGSEMIARAVLIGSVILTSR